LSNGGLLNARTQGQGNAGDVNIVASNTAAFDGVGSNGLPSGALSSVEETAVGRGGNINVAAGSIALTNGAQLRASTFGSGNAGNVNILASGTVSFNGVGSDGLPSGAFSSVNEEATGDGGSINISTRSLSVNHGAQVNVSSLEKAGNAGNLYIEADSIYLDNQGTFRADSVSGRGGNVYLQAQDLLLLRRNSQISAISGTSDAGGYGGNFSIDALFIAAIPSENSDIITNAFTGIGGNIRITAQGGIFGTQFRQQLTPKSDIVASGTVQLYIPNVNPTQGLVKLPTTPVDPSRQIDQGCSSAGRLAHQESKFTIIGRRGLPQSPTEVISPDMVQDDLGTPIASNPPTRESVKPSPSSPPQQLVEAQGWVVDDLGVVTLVAAAPTVTPHSGALVPASCQIRGTTGKVDERVGSSEELVSERSR
jgi:large exoprotein involved in heme utilization and adhesion